VMKKYEQLGLLYIILGSSLASLPRVCASMTMCGHLIRNILRNLFVD